MLWANRVVSCCAAPDFNAPVDWHRIISTHDMAHLWTQGVTSFVPPLTPPLYHGAVLAAAAVPASLVEHGQQQQQQQRVQPLFSRVDANEAGGTAVAIAAFRWRRNGGRSSSGTSRSRGIVRLQPMLAATTTPSATESKNSLSTTTTTTTSRADFLRLWQAGALLAAAAIVGTGASGASAATGAATRLGDEQNASNDRYFSDKENTRRLQEERRYSQQEGEETSASILRDDSTDTRGTARESLALLSIDGENDTDDAADPDADVAAAAAAALLLLPKPPSSVPHDASYYLKCALGGVLCCGPTHTALTPLDVAKCNMQTDPDKYNDGLAGSLETIAREGGSGSIWKGWLPTLLGYSFQGCLKFGLYELFKDVFSAIMGEDVAYLYRGLIYLGGAASAEFFADVALCPLEMVKVKIQTSPLGSFPTALAPALSKMRDNSTTTKFPFGSLVPLWSRQIPYTMTKFYFFEKIVELLYATVLTNPRSSYDMDVQLAVTFASGYLAGVICAVVSHPADVIVSKMGEGGKSSVQILSELGLNGVWGGLGTRMFVIGTLTGLQWWIYDIFKAFLGLGTTGG